MSAFQPADQAERDAIVQDIHENVCVEAGAGTGKTTVLVRRIVNILSSGAATVDRLAVITFTEKAAAELASRVRGGLEQALASAPEGTDAHGRITAAVRDLNHAHIETIHAFASSLLRERPVEAGLDPGFQVLDQLPAQLEFESQYNEWLTAEMATEPPPDALVDPLNLDLKFDRVRDAAERLNEHRELLPLPPYETEVVDVDALLDRLAAANDDLAGMHGLVKDPEDLGYKQMVRVIADVEELLLLRGHDAAARRSIVQFEWIKRTAGNQTKWNPGACVAARTIVVAVADAIDGARAAMRERATANLLLWLQGFVLKYQQHRRDAGLADFDDLLVWTRDLLRDQPDVRAYFQSKYQCVLVDEFQDTDPLQVEIVVLLCADGDIPPDWRHTKLRPGSLFVVGDPKQSIYRFRSADIAMYDEVKRHIFGGAPRRITQNFRSASPVIDWVNDAFGQLFVQSEGVQPQYIDLTPHPAFACEDAVTVIRPEPAADSAGAIREAEAAALVSLIAQQVRAQGWHVRGDEDAPSRPATYRDVVVIVPNRTSLEIYEDAFARASVPYRHEGGRTFFTRQEVRELVAILRAIDDPADGVAAIAALRSPAFGCSDEELLLHRAGKMYFEYTSVRDDMTGPVAAAMRVLRDLAAKRHDTPLPDLVRAVLDQTRLVEFAMLQPQGDQVAANLLKVIDQARAFADATGSGLRGFVRWLKENIARTANETDASISEETDDVVRIVTIHASKGLEFPIVAFANMNANRRDWTNVIAGGGRLHMKLGAAADGFSTPGYAAAELAEKEHFAAEDVRLLYVAGTRAKDRLVLSFPAKTDPRAKNSLTGALLGVRADHGGEMNVATLPAFARDLPIWQREYAGAPSAAEIAGVSDARGEWIAAHAGLLERGKLALTVRTASSLKAGWERASSTEDDVRRGRGADFGTAVHALLERIGLVRIDEIDAVAAAVAEEFGQHGHAAEIAQVARTALDQPVIARAREAQKSRHMLLEVPFTAALPQDEALQHGLSEGIAEGRIDLLFEEAGELVIVDFKTDNVKGEALIRSAEGYRTQALVYAWAAHRATGMRVREVILLYARPGAEYAFPADDAFMAEAEALMRSPVAEEEEPAEVG